MEWRARRAFVVLPVLITIVIALLIGVLAVVQNQRQTDREATAESIGQDYLSDVATFRVRAARKIHAVDSGDAKKLERVVAAAIANPPRLPAVTAYGRQHSAAYRQAERTRATLLTPYRRLRGELVHAEAADAFIAAARKVLGMRATDIVGGGLISDSAELRSELIPAFAAARDEFDHVAVPPGRARLAAKVDAAVQYVIDESSILAARIDARQNFSFRYDEQFQSALDAVNDYATKVQGDVEEAIQAATNDS